MVRLGLNSTQTMGFSLTRGVSQIFLAPRSLLITSAPTRFSSNSIRQGIRFSSTKQAHPQSSLTWNEFLAKRIQRRRLNIAASILTGFVSVTVGWGILANVEIDPTEPIYGFNPLVVLPVSLMICAGLGSLLGPSLGTFLFRISLGKNFASFAQKNVEFLRHVKNNRPDPSKQTYANPVPDYYGEKIGSLKDYRRWLRDGIAYRKKVETFL